MQRWDRDSIQMSITTNNLKCHILPHHVKELVEIHKIKFWFTHFGVRTTKLCLMKDREMNRAETGDTGASGDVEGHRATPH